MGLDLRPFYRRVRDVVAPRATTLVIATALVLVGVYPGPALIVLRDRAWRTHSVVLQLADERVFWIAGLLVIVGPAIVLANIAPGQFDRWWEFSRNRAGEVRDRWFVTGAALFAVVVAAAASAYVLSRKPTTSDEVAQLWQARILLTGRLWLPADANPEFFALDNIIDQGRWYSQFPIGGPAAFAVAMMLNATWLLNPLLAGLTVVNVYRFASSAYGPGEARVAALLCATCPFLLLMSGSYMSHTLVAALATLALAELPVWASGTDGRRLRASVVIGLSLGAAIAVRPLDGAIAAITLGTFLVWHAAMRLRARVIPLLVTGAAGALPVAGLLATNWLTTGRPLLFGYEVLWGANHSLGFHDDPSGNPHSPARAVTLATAYLLQLNWSLFEWPIAGLLVVALALVVIGKLGQWETLLLAWFAAQLGAYAAYWHAGTFFGPRYLFTVVPALLIIVARGLVATERNASPNVRRSVVAAVVVSVVSSWLIPMPPVGALGTARAARPVRSAFKVDFDPILTSLEGTKALIFVGEPASGRLMRRLWGLGISRPDAARLVATKDHCALLDAAVSEARYAGTPVDRLSRLERAKAYRPPEGFRLLMPDPSYRVSNRESVTPSCRADLTAFGPQRGAISYGQALLLNEIGADGRIAGPIVFVTDLGEHNEVLRGRFGDRPWYRIERTVGTSDSSLTLVPYR